MVSNATVTFAFVGDIMIHSGYNELVREKGPLFLFEHVAAPLKNADIRFGNLETVLSERGEPVGGKLCLRGDSRYIEALGEMGFDVLSLANNHAFDFGEEAFADMVSCVEGRGIQIVGAGRSLAQSRELKTIIVKDVRIGFLAYSARGTDGSDYAETDRPGAAPLEEEFVVEDVRRYRDQVDHLVVSLHWGVEYSEYPTPDQVTLGRKIIDAGARIIVGHHPHILQGYERYNGAYIFYSLGNFCDADVYWEGDDKTYQANLKVADRETVMVVAELTKTGIGKIDCMPLWLNDQGQPEMCRGEKASSIVGKMERRSEAIFRPDFKKYWEDMILDKRVGNAFRIWLNNGNLLHKIRNFKLSQFKTLWEMMSMYVQTKFSKESNKYYLINPGKDKKPRPFCGDDPK
jgi:poly-gamma-glutamate capsule biosynthesis protein CapA/YwtB (metallophosphatase superfamily)